jgi:hypothetical protein
MKETRVICDGCDKDVKDVDNGGHDEVEFRAQRYDVCDRCAKKVEACLSATAYRRPQA